MFELYSDMLDQIEPQTDQDTTQSGSGTTQTTTQSDQKSSANTNGDHKNILSNQKSAPQIGKSTQDGPQSDQKNIPTEPQNASSG